MFPVPPISINSFKDTQLFASLLKLGFVHKYCVILLQGPVEECFVMKASTGSIMRFLLNP